MSQNPGSTVVDAQVNLANVSIILLSYERQPYIRRHIAYFWNHPVNLIIADGSATPMQLPSLEGAGCTIRYIHVPGADTINVRLELAMQKIATEFVMMMDDADLYFVTGIENAMRSLSEDQTQSAAAGRVAHLGKNMRSQELVCRDWGHWSSSLELTGSPEKNLLRMMHEARTANLYYTLMRRDVFEQILGKTLELSFSSAHATEIFVSGSLVVRGNFRLGSYPFWIRTEVPSVPTALSESKSIFEWHEDSGPDRQAFIATLAKELEFYSGIVDAEAAKVVEAYLEIHYSQAASPPPPDRRLRVLIRSLPFGDVLLKKYRALRSHLRTHNRPKWKNAVQYWTSVSSELSKAQEDDLRTYEQLVSRYPEGIESLDELTTEVTKPEPPG